MTAPDGTDRPTTVLLRSAGRLPGWARHVGRGAFALVASSGLSIALTQGAAAADPLVPPPTEPPINLTETGAQPPEVVIATTEAAGDAVAPTVDDANLILEPTTDTLEPVLDTTAAIAQPIGESVAPVLAPIVDVSAPVADQVLAILEPAQEVVAPVLAPIVDASARVTGQIVASHEPVEVVVAPITELATEIPTVAPRVSRPTDPVIDSQLEVTRSADRRAAVQGAFVLAAPAPPAVIALAESAADVRPLPAWPDRPLIASSTPISGGGHGSLDWTPMAVLSTLLLLGLVSRALITTAFLRPPTMALFVPVPPG